MDIVGLLTPSQGFTYFFTRALFREGISRFGIPGEMTSYHSSRFTSELWDQLRRILGTKAYRTASYHPQANDIMERFHHTMKASLMDGLRNNHNWMEELLVVMLGLCTAFKEDLGCFSAELVYSTHFGFLGDFSRNQEHYNLPIQLTSLHHSIEQWITFAQLQWFNMAHLHQISMLHLTTVHRFSSVETNTSHHHIPI